MFHLKFELAGPIPTHFFVNYWPTFAPPKNKFSNCPADGGGRGPGVVTVGGRQRNGLALQPMKIPGSRPPPTWSV